MKHIKHMKGHINLCALQPIPRSKNPPPVGQLIDILCSQSPTCTQPPAMFALPLFLCLALSSSLHTGNASLYPQSSNRQLSSLHKCHLPTSETSLSTYSDSHTNAYNIQPLLSSLAHLTHPVRLSLVTLNFFEFHKLIMLGSSEHVSSFVLEQSFLQFHPG